MDFGIQPGAVVGGDFEVLRPLGSGGMGAVFVVMQRSIGRERALKVMHPQVASNAQMRARFVREAKIGAQIESAHVIEVIAAGVDDATGAPWLVTELLDGETLRGFVERDGPPPLPMQREILRQIGHAVGAAHHVGLVHRDLKPDNIFVARSRRQDSPFIVKLLDFGIAKMAAEAATQASMAVASPLWMAPEQSDTELPVTPATDVWALGLVTFFVMTGKNFWISAHSADANAMSILRELTMDDIPAASARASELGAHERLPPGFDAWFARCVARDPAARFPDAKAASQAFDHSFGATLSAGPSGGAWGPQPGRASLVSAPVIHVPQVSRPSSPAYVVGATSPSAGMPTPVSIPTPPISMPRESRRAGAPIGLIVAAVAVVAGGAAAAIYFATREAPAPPAPRASASASAQREGAKPETAKVDPSGPALADLFDRQKPEKTEAALAALRSACEAGFGDGCAGLGIAADRGWGSSIDVMESVRRFQAACDKGSELGCAHVGRALVNGTGGMSVDVERGAGMIKKACEAKARLACNLLGELHRSGRGVEKSEAKATELFRRACDEREQDACANLGLAMQFGRGTSVDKRAAMQLFDGACRGGSSIGCVRWGRGLAEGLDGTKDPVKAFGVFQRACDQGDLDGCNELGRAYDDHVGVAEDRAKAFELFERSCKGGSPFGCTSLGFAYLEGRGVKQDVARGRALYEDACKADVWLACANLGFIVYSGLGGAPPDPDRAKGLLEKACDNDIADGCNNLGLVYWEGKGTTARDQAKARELFKKACDRGSPKGCDNAKY